MNAKDYLLQIQILDEFIEDKLDEITRWKSVAMKITSSIEDDKVQSSGDKQKMEKAICEYISVEENELSALFKERKEIIETIKLLPIKEYSLLNKIYVKGMDIDKAAIEMDRSYSWATTVHGRALAKVQKILNEREENEN